MIGEPGSEPGADRVAASPSQAAEDSDDVVEGGGGPRRQLPRRLVVGFYVACGVAALALAVAEFADSEGGTVAAPTPSLADGVPDESSSLGLVLRCGGRDRDLPVCTDRPEKDQSAAGRHSLTVADVRFSYSLPSKPSLETGDFWTRYNSNYISKSSVGSQAAEAVIYWTDVDGGTPEAGIATCWQWWGYVESLADFAARASTMVGTELISGPSNVTVGGVAAKQVVLIVREDLGCDPGYFYTWKYVSGGPFWPETGVGDTIRVWLVDVDGTRLFIAGETTKDAGPILTQELQQIIESIRFG